MVSEWGWSRAPSSRHESSAKLVKFQFYLCWLFYVLRIESVCIVRGLFSFVGTQSSFFLDQKSKACWRWTKKMAKWSNREGVSLSIDYTHCSWVTRVGSLYLVMNENGHPAKKWKWHCTWAEEADGGGEKEIISWHTAKARLAVQCSTIIQRPMSNPYYTNY